MTVPLVEEKNYSIGEVVPLNNIITYTPTAVHEVRLGMKCVEPCKGRKAHTLPNLVPRPSMTATSKIQVEG